MIYWFIGNCGAGKTTLAKKFKEHNDKYSYTVFFDGDDLRQMFANAYKPETLTKEYRIENTKNLQNLVKYIHDQGFDVVISTVNPCRDVRDAFKDVMGMEILEIYVHREGKSVRESFKVKDFEIPTNRYIDINTTGVDVEQSFIELLVGINRFEVENKTL